MTSGTLQEQLEEAIPKLLDLARTLTWNKISDNCLFIRTEIQHSEENFHVQRQLLKKENDKKVPLALPELMPGLLSLYDNLYDITLYIYRATKDMNVIDIRYYPKSSLSHEYRQQVLQNPPMLHCKVTMPPWLSDKEKFDINWEHYKGLNKLRLFWLKLKLKAYSFLHKK